MPSQEWNLSEDRFFDPNPTQRALARQLYTSVKNTPIISPHGHVDPSLFADEKRKFGSPAELLIIPDHYVFRMLYSQGINLNELGIPRKNNEPKEQDHRKIWQIFADNFYLFNGTPTGIWLSHELQTVFGIHTKLKSNTAQDIYDLIEAKINSKDFQPRPLFDKFNIEILCTTDPAWDDLSYHKAIKASEWNGDIRPTFRPDGVINLDTSDWAVNISALGSITKIDINSFGSFIQALETQRVYFKSMGASASDHAALTPYTTELSEVEAERIFQRALKQELEPGDARKFTAHMLIEMARMSLEDGLVMQIHPGSYRNYNQAIYEEYGADKGSDIPTHTEYTKNLNALLNKFGNDPRLQIIIFTLDETTYGRELAPLAGHYPSLKLGPPWWFFDSLNGMRRYFDQVMETAGLYNTAGFNDDTRAFPSIPARHDLWRRASANWLAGLTIRGIIDEQDATEMIYDMAYRLAKKAYKL
jgi:glucuronate isomerase